MSRDRALVGFAVALAVVIGSTATAVNRFPMSAAQSTVYQPGPGVDITLPAVLREVKPYYTQAAMQEKIQGSVWMSAVVTDQGDVGDVTVTRSLDAEYGLDQAAVDALRQWKFKPGLKDGEPVAVRVAIEMTFTLK